MQIYLYNVNFMLKVMELVCVRCLKRVSVWIAFEVAINNKTYLFVAPRVEEIGIGETRGPKKKKSPSRSRREDLDSLGLIFDPPRSSYIITFDPDFTFSANFICVSDFSVHS